MERIAMHLLPTFALIAVISLAVGTYLLVKMPGRKKAQILVARTRSDYVRAGTFAIAATSSRSHASEILVRGAIHAAQGTTVKLLSIYVAA